MKMSSKKQKVTVKGALRAGFRAVFTPGGKYLLNKDMLRDYRKRPYLGRTKDCEELLYLVPVDFRHQAYYDLQNKRFLYSQELDLDSLEEIDLEKETEISRTYMDLFYRQEDFLQDIEKEYVTYLQKVKELEQHVVVFQLSSNVSIEDANGLFERGYANQEEKKEAFDSYLEYTKAIAQYHRKINGTDHGIFMYGYRQSPNSREVYLLDGEAIAFPILEQVSDNFEPIYYVKEDHIRSLSSRGLKSVVDVHYFYEQLTDFYKRRMDLYQEAPENKAVVKRIENHKKR